MKYNYNEWDEEREKHAEKLIQSAYNATQMFPETSPPAKDGDFLPSPVTQWNFKLRRTEKQDGHDNVYVALPKRILQWELNASPESKPLQNIKTEEPENKTDKQNAKSDTPENKDSEQSEVRLRPPPPRGLPPGQKPLISPGQKPLISPGQKPLL